MSDQTKSISPSSRGGIRPETDRAKIRELLSGINWDSTRDVMEYYDVLWGRVPESKWFNRHQVLARLLMHMDWYKLLRIVPFEEMRERLNDEVIRYLWPSSVRKEYEVLKRALSGASVSLTGWGDEAGEKLSFAFFSHGRYGAG
jgi:hypothetical protein